MANITHPTMRKSTPIQQEVVEPPKQNLFVVEDLSSFGSAPEPQQAMAEVAMEPKPVVDVTGKKQLEDLLFLGRTISMVELAGHSFEISTLTHKEHRQLMAELYKVSDEANQFTVRLYTLAFVLRTIDGVRLEDVPVEGQFDSELARKIGLIDNMQYKIIERLFQEFERLTLASEELTTGDQIKK